MRLNLELVCTDAICDIGKLDFIIEKEANNKELMTLKVECSSDSDFYRISPNKDEKSIVADCIGNEAYPTITEGQVGFASDKSYPDGIILEHKADGEIIFHIIELKRNPISDALKIKKQFLSAHFNCKTLALFLRVSEDLISYKYYVSFPKVVVDTHIINTTKNSNYRTIPGHSVALEEDATPGHIKDWFGAKHIIELGTFRKEIEFEQLAMDFDDNYGEYAQYCTSINL